LALAIKALNKFVKGMMDNKAATRSGGKKLWSRLFPLLVRVDVVDCVAKEIVCCGREEVVCECCSVAGSNSAAVVTVSVEIGTDLAGIRSDLEVVSSVCDDGVSFPTDGWTVAESRIVSVI